MQMKNLKMTEQSPTPQLMPEAPQYPCGLRLYLDEDTLTKLGVTELPEVGAKMMIQAQVMVCDVSENKSIYGSHRSLGLQITDMGLGSKSKS